MRTKELFAFIRERHAIYERRNSGQPKPWTKDSILQRYRFCNVYRELDTETKWLADNWRKNATEDFWFAALVFRFVNWHPTAMAISGSACPTPWDPDRFISAIEQRKKAGEKVYSGAYMISTHGVREEKHFYLAKSLTKIWDSRNEIRYKTGESLREFHSRLEGCFDVGSFIAGQVIADAKYQGSMVYAPDWQFFAASGPGSRRGLNRIFNRPPETRWSEKEWRQALSILHNKIHSKIVRAKMPSLHAQDLQNCLCEFDKYERARLGEGRPRSTYPGVC